MKDKPVIHHRNLPRKPPGYTTVLGLLLLKVFNAPEWAWGAVGVLILGLWGIWLLNIIQYKEREVNIFRDDTNNNIPGPKIP